MTNDTKAVKALNNAASNHREVLLKHEMVLDFIFAEEGGMYAALNLTGSACCVLLRDPHDNITQLIHLLINSV